MKTTPLPRSRKMLKGTLVLLAALSLASLNAVSAVISEKFDTVGSIPSGWTIAANGGTANIGVADSGLGYNALRFARASGSGTQVTASTLYYTGTEGDIVAGKVADFTASVIIASTNISGSTSISSTYNGMIIRASKNTYGTSGGYYIGINGESDGIGIWDNPPGHQLFKADAITQPQAQRALFSTDFFESAPAISRGTSLLLSVTAVGSTIEASVWTLTLDGVADIKIGELIYENATNTAAGTVGLRFSPGNTNAAGYYRDFNLQTIPEPGTVAMLMGAGAMAFLLRIRRRA